MRSLIIAALLLVVPAVAHGQTDQQILVARSFGYAMQAQGWCDGMMIHLQTEEKLARINGVKLREGDLKMEYLAGLTRFMEDEISNGAEVACKNAWDRVGPNGSEHAFILMETP
ncbi:hypothetical protein [Devosia naphthalenivorans]|uniref:hypothetical protein n=1 Tax=Devosia naphthalenivorans TaxID=2082392 RepID=UPI000D33EBB5|nr:hypothetical protein [Devosia naphthalenivorans]